MKKNIDSYKEFIDEAVSQSQSVTANWIRNGSFPQIESNKKRNKILASMSQDQLDEVASMVEEEKSSGFHDLLALLYDEAEIIYKGVTLPKDSFGTEFYFDYMARLEGDEWPNQE